jgi:type II secretory pathway component PulJ
MTRRRRGIFLIEMLPVLFALGIGGTLMAVGLASIQRSHKRVAEFSNRYASLNDFLRFISRDVRTATTVSLREGDGEDLQYVLAVGDTPRQVVYRFFEDRVERAGFEGDHVADKRWDATHAEFTLDVTRPAGGADAIVDLTVRWKRTAKDDPQPHRRFDVALRCAGEIYHESE